jgi:uncharacterized membrane protein
MTYENIAAPVATRRRGAARLSAPALGVAALGALLTVVATFLNWATLTLQGETPVTANGLDEDMNGRITVVLGLVALVVVGVLALRAVKGLWVVLPVLGLLITFIGWAQTRKLQNTLDAIGVGATDAVKATNGIGVWLTIVGGILLLATAVLVPATRRRA